MKIGVTGATGHVGANLVRILIAKGYQVRALVRKDTRALQGIPVEKIQGDLLHQETLMLFCDGMEVIIHLAALISIGSNPYDQVFNINVNGTKNLMSACKKQGVKRFIHFSSIHALEHKPIDQLMDERRPLAITSPMAYERTKAIAEKWVLQQNSSDFEVIVLNPTAIIGPNDFKPSFLGEVVMMIYRGSLPGLVSGGYNWVDVRDVANAAAHAITDGKAGERYILSGKWQSLKTLANEIIRIRGGDRSIPIFPLWLAKIGLPFMMLVAKLKGHRPLYTKQSLLILQTGNRNISSKKAEAELGFSVHSLQETLRDTIDWFQKNAYL